MQVVSDQRRPDNDDRMTDGIVYSTYITLHMIGIACPARADGDAVI